jgi:hypothetical protein
MNKVCPDCNRIYNDKYSYCPYDGEILIYNPSNAKIYKEITKLKEGSNKQIYLTIVALGIAYFTIYITILVIPSQYKDISTQILERMVLGMAIFLILLAVYRAFIFERIKKIEWRNKEK